MADLSTDFLKDKVGMVIPVGQGRNENIEAVLESLTEQIPVASFERLVKRIVLIYDGAKHEIDLDNIPCPSVPISIVELPKHQPGDDQPRNIGVRVLRELSPEIGHVWFLDSDVILDPMAATAYEAALALNSHRILIGPYEWLPPGARHRISQLRNDPRWASFESNSPEKTVVEDLSAGLGCFSGNLIWPIDEFERVGGFWNELHHGRCEDGELGLRAVAMGVPIGFVRDARGFHLDHDRNHQWIEDANKRDVPMLNARHPWVQGSGLFMVEKDGTRFDASCPCGWTGNTMEIWTHQGECNRRLGE